MISLNHDDLTEKGLPPFRNRVDDRIDERFLRVNEIAEENETLGLRFFEATRKAREIFLKNRRRYRDAVALKNFAFSPVRVRYEERFSLFPERGFLRVEREVLFSNRDVRSFSHWPFNLSMRSCKLSLDNFAPILSTISGKASGEG